MPRTSGRRPIGRSARSSPPATGWSPAPRPGAAHLSSLAPDARQGDPGPSRPRPRPLSRPDSPAPAPRRARSRRSRRHPLGRPGGGEEGLSTICWPRWRCCRRISPGASSISAAARCCPASRPRPRASASPRASPGAAPQTQAEVLAALRAADLFVLASRIARDGDRDGLPNVLMEAASQGLASVATRAGAIAELLIEGETGLLVPAGDPAALAAAIGRLIGDPALRAPARRRRPGPGPPAISASAPASPSSPPSSGQIRGRGLRMRLAFYAPLKPPDHPVPSGDRRMARLLIQAWARRAIEVELASRLAQPPAPRARSRRRSPWRRAAERAAPAGPLSPPARRAERPAGLVHLSPLLQGAGLARARYRPGAGHPLSRGRGLGRRQARRRPPCLGHDATAAALRAAARSSSSIRRTGRAWSLWSPRPIAWSSCRPSSIWRISPPGRTPRRRRAGRSPSVMGWTPASPGC